ncbi:MAG: GAF domain-containing protein [Deltaproteobacteria bacterium]|nr:GAF domain-containing protein [Deltaproteobacteria bacterium]
MRKRLAIVGHSEEGLAMIPLLEANPDVEVIGILTDEPLVAMRALTAVEPALAERFRDRITSNPDQVLRTAGLVALVDADPSEELRAVLEEAPDRGVQVTTPLIAKLLYAFGPVDGSRKSDLLHTLGEILESYNLTVDREGLLRRILQIAVGATGADRGSLLLYEEDADELAAVVAIGIEREVLHKIRIAPGEGIAGRAFAERRAILLHGKADHARYEIVRERDDIESAISVPLIHDDVVLGVLNLSHGRTHGAFDEEDLAFVEQLAALDAKFITRAEEYRSLRRDSVLLRAQSEVRDSLSGSRQLPVRLSEVCRYAAGQLERGLCHVYLLDAELQVLSLVASSAQLDPLAPPVRLAFGQGLPGRVAERRTPIVVEEQEGDERGRVGVYPLIARDELLGVMSLETVSSGGDCDLLREQILAITETLAQELSDLLRETRMQREATKMAAISEAMSVLGRSADSAELQRSLASTAAMILEAEHAILRLQDESGAFQVRSYFGSSESEAQTQLLALEKELSISAIQRQVRARALDLDEREGIEHLGLGSALVQPLQHGGQVIGTLSVLGKVAHDPLAGERFNEADQQVLGRLAEQAVLILTQVESREAASQHQRFDDLTGLPNRVLLRERLEQEISRSSQSGHRLALVRFELDGLDAVIASQTEGEGNRVVQAIADALRRSLRDFDVLARSGSDTFHIVVPELGGEISELLGPLARQTRDAIRHESETPPGLADRLRLVIGYGVFPDDGHTAKALLERADEPRILES